MYFLVLTQTAANRSSIREQVLRPWHRLAWEGSREQGVLGVAQAQWKLPFLQHHHAKIFFPPKEFTQMESAAHKLQDGRTLSLKVREGLGVQRSMLKQATGRFFSRENTKQASSVHTSSGSYFKKPGPVWLRQKNPPEGTLPGAAFMLSAWFYICDKSWQGHISRSYFPLYLLLWSVGGTFIIRDGFPGMKMCKLCLREIKSRLQVAGEGINVAISQGGGRQ